MKRIAMLVCVVLGITGFAFAGNGNGKDAWRSITELMKGYMTFLVGVDKPDHVKNVVFMPLPSAQDDDGDGLWEGEMNVTLHTGDSFAMTMYVWYGEIYDNGTPPDDWSSVDPAGITGSSVLLKIDGKTWIDSTHDDMADWYFEFDPTQWDNPVYYASPSSYGSIAAIWAKGLGFVHEPLSKGSHTMDIRVSNSTYGGNWHNVWHIDVVK